MAEIIKSSLTFVLSNFSLTFFVMLEGGTPEDKPARYGDLVHRLFADQLAWARARSHTRLLDEQASRDAVAMACTADAACVTLRA